MNSNLYEMVLAALLHDIGKPIQRAFGSMANLEWRTYDMASEICPINKYGRYSHQHVLFTNAFFDLMKEREYHLPEGLDFERVIDIASFHHKPESAKHPGLAWICALADRYSAGMDRRNDEEETDGQRGREAFRRLPLRSIFDEIVLDPKRKEPEKHAYHLKALDPYCTETTVPIPWKGEDPELPEKYKRVWEGFLEDFVKLSALSTSLTGPLFEEALLGMLERYTWSIPSSTINIPDISLYDHSVTTAAIAACMHKFHQERGELENLKAIKDDQKPKFRFLSGDLSGIQNTIFNLANQGIKGTGKILRARSFMLGAVMEAASLLALEAFGLPKCCVIHKAGGRFLILTPDASDCLSSLNKLQQKVDQWLLNTYCGSLALSLSLTSAFRGADFHGSCFEPILTALSLTIEDAKQRPLRFCGQGPIKVEFPFDRACQACGTRPAQLPEESEFRCHTCHREFQVGRWLPTAEYLVWGKNLPDKTRKTEILGLDLVFPESDSFSNGFENVKSIRRLTAKKAAFPWADHYLANYIPRFENVHDALNPRYAKMADQDTVCAAGMPKTFAHIGAEALEEDENDSEFRGKPFLAILKADVDLLGMVFSRGLRRSKATSDRMTLSRIAQLSRMLDLYFSGYFQGVIRREFPDTYTVYAGGDDLLLIGPWRQTLKLAQHVWSTFTAYTGNNANLTISAGLSLLHPNHPVNRAAQEAEAFLEKAKADGRNRICAIIPKSMPWDRYRDRLDDAQWIHDQMLGKDAVGTGFVYRIFELARDAQAAASGTTIKAGWRAKLAYHLARNIKGKKEEKEARIVHWLEHLGFDDITKLVTGQPNIDDWPLPLSIALYRHRK